MGLDRRLIAILALSALSTACGERNPFASFESRCAKLPPTHFEIVAVPPARAPEPSGQPRKSALTSFGHYAERAAEKGKPESTEVDTGRFAALWRREADGAWRLARLMMQPAPLESPAAPR